MKNSPTHDVDDKCLRTQEVCNFCYNAAARSEIERTDKRSRRTNPAALTDDLITKIFLRLPVKTLVKLKCVSKSWYNLIRSSAFISTHYDANKNNKLSLCCLSYGGNRVTFLLSDIKLDLTVPYGDVNLKNVKIVGCSYGLVCLSLPYMGKRYTNYLLWNPATGHLRRITLEEPCVGYNNWVYSGFYFDYIENTHKIVRLLSIKKIYRTEESIELIDIFTVRDNLWKEKELIIPPNQGSFLWGAVTCIGRFLYWKAYSFPNRKKQHVVCFDMVDEIFLRIELPCPESYCSLAQYEKSLAIFVSKQSHHSHDFKSFDVWKMLSDCGSKGNPSWYKVLTLTPPFPVHVGGLKGILVKGGVLMAVLATKSGYVLWNTDSEETTELLGCNEGFFRQVFLYSESLASVC